MAAKVPTTLTKENWGSVNVLIAAFDGTVSSNDIDDDDTWASGVKASKIVGKPWLAQTSEGPNDCSVTDIDANGVLTFSAASATTGTLYLMYKDI